MADNTYTNISDLPTLASVGENTWTPVEVTGKVGKKVDLNTFAEKTDLPTVGTLNTTYIQAQTPSASESLSGTINLHKVAKTGRYSDLNTASMPHLSTDDTGELSTNHYEMINGTIKLHQLAKTGLYQDLNFQVYDNGNADGNDAYFLPEQSTGGAYYDDDTDVVMMRRYYKTWNMQSGNCMGVPCIIDLGYYDEAATNDPPIPEEARHPERTYTSLTKMSLFITNNGAANRYPVTTILLPAKDESRILDVEIATYDGTEPWDIHHPYSNSLRFLTCVSTIKTVDTAKPGLIRVTGRYFEIVQ